MSVNMSYCRWENTARALDECASDLEERMAGFGEDADYGDPEEKPEPLSRDERAAMLRLFQTMTEMLEQVGIHVDDDDVSSALSAAGL